MLSLGGKGKSYCLSGYLAAGGAGLPPELLRLLLWAALTLLIATTSLAQDDLPLYFFGTELSAQPDAFGGETPAAIGELFNTGADAYTNIRLTLRAYSDEERLVGEGYGFLVDACGTALLDYALQPGAHQTFSIPYELFDEGEASQIKLAVAADSAPPAPARPDMPAVTPISEAEVVMLEWLDDDTLIFGVGCDGAVFTELSWQRYRLDTRALAHIAHPKAAAVTPELIRNSGLTMISQSGERNPELYATSHLSFPPRAQRVVFQNDLHTLFSAELDGSFPRIIHDGLHAYSLRGFQWARGRGIFLAYYFGGYGEPVRYFMANTGGARLSLRLETMPPSITAPAPSDDGLAAVIGRVQDGKSGYWLQYALGGRELLLEADLPGNNFPAPILRDEKLYIASPGHETPILQCYNLETQTLADISALPLRLTRATRAWMWLSPGGGALALASNGADGGLWLLDVAGKCAAP